MMRVAIVGAGVTGLTCARALTAAGHDVVVFEKSRGPGGRMSTRRSPHGRFDHGAAVLGPGEVPATDGVTLAPLAPFGVVPVPAASALPRALAEGLGVRAGIHVAPLEVDPAAGPVALGDRDGAPLGAYDRVVLTAPAPQVAELARDAAPALAAAADEVGFLPCWAAMAAWEEPIAAPVAAVRGEGPIRWAAAEAGKPGREPGTRWVVQADEDFSAARLEDDPGDVAADLLAALAAALGAPGGLPRPAHVAAHRWRYARVERPLAVPLLADPSGRVLAGGDWCTPAGPDADVAAGTVAAAAAAGRALAAALPQLTDGSSGIRASTA